MSRLQQFIKGVKVNIRLPRPSPSTWVCSLAGHEHGTHSVPPAGGGRPGGGKSPGASHSLPPLNPLPLGGGETGGSVWINEQVKVQQRPLPPGEGWGEG